jgi:hypothetical protein
MENNTVNTLFVPDEDPYFYVSNDVLSILKNMKGSYHLREYEPFHKIKKNSDAARGKPIIQPSIVSSNFG